MPLLTYHSIYKHVTHKWQHGNRIHCPCLCHSSLHPCSQNTLLHSHPSSFCFSFYVPIHFNNILILVKILHYKSYENYYCVLVILIPKRIRKGDKPLVYNKSVRWSIFIASLTIQDTRLFEK